LAYSTAYWENKEQVSEIWTMQMEGNNKQRLSKAKGTIHALEWSPAGNQLLYLYQSSSRNASSDPADLKLLSSDGGSDKLLANNIRMASERRYRPRWSPDGRYVAFIQVDDAAQFLADWREPGGNVYVADASTGQITKLSAFIGRSNGFPTWSPDGNYIAFVSSSIAGDPREEMGPTYAEIWVAKVDGSQLRPVSNSAKWRNALAWLPSISVK
jgi:Tol biopolymer transport system component